MKEIIDGRKYQIQGQIVKIMKTQKSYKMSLLMADVMRNISLFKAEPKMVKEQIDNLMTQEYIKRDENDRQIIVYLP